MKKLLFCLLPVVLCAVLGRSQDKSDYGVVPPLDLSLTLEITNQSYCHVSDEDFMVNMEVRLRFTNVSDHNVILSRKIENPSIVRAATTLDAGKNHDFEYDPIVDFFTAKMPPDAPRFGKTPDLKYFIILAPKETYETTVQSGIATLQYGYRKGLLSKGDHVLQLGVNMWPYDWPYFTARTDKDVLSKRWASYGRLETGFIYSEFLPFTVPETFENPPCESRKKRK
jgi:hypothetical protein